MCLPFYHCLRLPREPTFFSQRNINCIPDVSAMAGHSEFIGYGKMGHGTCVHSEATAWCVTEKVAGAILVVKLGVRKLFFHLKFGKNGIHIYELYMVLQLSSGMSCDVRSLNYLPDCTRWDCNEWHLRELDYKLKAFRCMVPTSLCTSTNLANCVVPNEKDSLLMMKTFLGTLQYCTMAMNHNARISMICGLLALG